jgi:hypothetical protein
MEFTKIILNKEHIKKIRYKEKAIIVYMEDEVFVCKRDSEKEIANNFVEYILKGKGDGNARI